MSNYRLCRFTMKHGNKQEMPKLLLGEPAFCKDTGEMFIGNGEDKEPTRIGSVGEEQIKALEEQVNNILELAKKTASTLETNLMSGDTKLGSVSISSQGVTVKDASNNVKFSVDSSFTTYAETLKVKNISLSNVSNAGIMPVTRGYKNQQLVYYVSTSPKGKGDGTSRDNACSDFYTVADTIFKTYGHLCPATKVAIWVDPGVYTQDMSMPYFPGNIWEVYVQTDVNGTTTFANPISVYCSNTSIHFYGNKLGTMKFQSVSGLSTTDNTGAYSVRTPFAIFGTNVNLEFSHCHWVTPVTSEYKKYCLYTTPGSRNVNFAFSSCDFYGYDALLSRGEPHGEILMWDCWGNLDNWIDVDANNIPNLNSLGLRIYIKGAYPVVANSNSLIDIFLKGTCTPVNSSYYKTTTNPGGSGEVVEPPVTTEAWVNKEDRYTLESKGTRVINWGGSFTPDYDPGEYPSLAVSNGNGESSYVDALEQGSSGVYDANTNEVVWYDVDYGNWVFDRDTMSNFQALGLKAKSGDITNLTAKFIFTKYSYYGNSSAKPRIIYPASGIEIHKHMISDKGYYVTQSGKPTSDGSPTFILELDGEHPLASKLKSDLFLGDAPGKSDALYERYGSDWAYYGIQLGSYLANDRCTYKVELVVTYKEKAKVIG